MTAPTPPAPAPAETPAPAPEENDAGPPGRTAWFNIHTPAATPFGTETGWNVETPALALEVKGGEPQESFVSDDAAAVPALSSFGAASSALPETAKEHSALAHVPGPFATAPPALWGAGDNDLSPDWGASVVSSGDELAEANPADWLTQTPQYWSSREAQVPLFICFLLLFICSYHIVSILVYFSILVLKLSIFGPTVVYFGPKVLYFIVNLFIFVLKLSILVLKLSIFGPKVVYFGLKWSILV